VISGLKFCTVRTFSNTAHRLWEAGKYRKTGVKGIFEDEIESPKSLQRFQYLHKLLGETV